MYEKWQDVTPRVAAHWLKANTNNRNLRPNAVAAMVADMLNGRWVTPPVDSIVFGSDGSLYDGQHRLTAIVKAGVTLRMRVVHDAPPEILPTIDVGKSRTAGDQLRIQGVTNSARIAAMVRCILSYDRMPGLVWNGQNSFSTPEVVAYTQQHQQGLTDAWRIGDGIRREVTLPLTGTAAGVLAYLVRRDSTQEADLASTFFDGLLTGTNLWADDPRLALRRYTPGSQVRDTHRQQCFLAAAIKAWNGFVEDRPIKGLRWRREELPMPRVL